MSLPDSHFCCDVLLTTALKYFSGVLIFTVGKTKPDLLNSLASCMPIRLTVILPSEAEHSPVCLSQPSMGMNYRKAPGGNTLLPCEDRRLWYSLRLSSPSFSPHSHPFFLFFFNNSTFTSEV